MLIKRLCLRNFRVYEDPLELEFPPGLVGIYGPNGAGKSTLLEAILWALWGKARTKKEQIRTTGVGGDGLTEVEFEHEGHLYLVRRTIKGSNSAIAVEVQCDGVLMSTGTRDAQHFVESILGMDDASFRASVFTEQNQLSAFSSQTPAERRRLVLQLLGVTPLDSARDAARKDARQLISDHDRLRSMLPDLEAAATQAMDADARAGATEVVADDDARVARAAEDRAARACKEFEELDRRRQEHDAFVIEGRAAKQELESLTRSVQEHRAELRDLDALATRLAALEGDFDGRAASEEALRLLRAAAAFGSAAERVLVPPEPAAVDEAGFRRATDASASAREQVAALAALARVAAAEVARARDAAKGSTSLSGEADCPLCGQPLGDAFNQVRQHRLAELAEAEARAGDVETKLGQAQRMAAQAERHLKDVANQAEMARQARLTWEQADRKRADADAAFGEAWHAVITWEGRMTEGGAALDELRVAGLGPDLPAPAQLRSAVETMEITAAASRKAAEEAHRIRGKLERRTALEAMLGSLDERAEAAEGRLVTLREKVRGLGFDKDALQQAARARDAADAAWRRASAGSARSALDAARERERSNAAVQTLEAAREQHGELSDLEQRSLHVARVAELLSDFRNTVVASVGPRLAVQAAELFGELTDHEYERLEVDPDDYQVKIGDRGELYGLDRFSGSEVDLANLALRVAISEHIHFQSGGSVGLLVLDEVFGPLDEDRKSRMLLALERLRGRFRQVLVVTHDPEIKEQLPNAIEVVKLPAHRATARVLGD